VSEPHTAPPAPPGARGPYRRSVLKAVAVWSFVDVRADRVRSVADALIEHETLSGDAVSRIVRDGAAPVASLRPVGSGQFCPARRVTS
jgi:hypothetical protein